MSPLLDLVAPMLRRLAANKHLLSAGSLMLVIVAIVADIGQGGLLPLVALIALSLWLIPTGHGWR